MRSLALVAVVACSLALTSQAQALALEQIDTFQSGTTAGWVVGLTGAVHPAPPHTAADCGPGGAGDTCLILTSVGGGGAGSRLVAANLTQWAGDYVAAGITGIEMDLRNLGSTDLTMRLLFEDPTAGTPSNLAVTSFGVTLPSGSDWTHVLFPIEPSTLVALQGNAFTALSNATVLRLYDSTGAAFPGPPKIALLGVDNIRAVPEPTTWMLLLAGLGLLGARAARRLR